MFQLSPHSGLYDISIKKDVEANNVKDVCNHEGLKCMLPVQLTGC